MIIYVLDTETTGLNGFPDDFVVDIGIVEADTEANTVTPVFSSVVGYDTDDWSDDQKDSWIFTHSSLSLEYVKHAPRAKDVADQVRYILAGNNVTSYNMLFDFKKFLDHRPWDLKHLNIRRMPDIMEAAAEYFEEPSPFGGYRWPKLDRAYRELCPQDPAGISKGQEHRALSDAVAAGYVLLALYVRGFYETDT